MPELLSLGLHLVPPTAPCSNRTRLALGLVLLARLSGCYHSLAFAEALWAHGPLFAAHTLRETRNLDLSGTIPGHLGMHDGWYAAATAHTTGAIIVGGKLTFSTPKTVSLPPETPANGFDSITSSGGFASSSSSAISAGAPWAALRPDLTLGHVSSMLLLSTFLRSVPSATGLRALYRIEDRRYGWALQFREGVARCSPPTPLPPPPVALSYPLRKQVGSPYDLKAVGDSKKRRAPYQPCVHELLRPNATLTLSVSVTYADRPSIWEWSKLLDRSGGVLWRVLPPPGEAYIVGGKPAKPARKVAGRPPSLDTFEIVLLPGQRLRVLGKREVTNQRSAAERQRVGAVPQHERSGDGASRVWADVPASRAYDEAGALREGVMVVWEVQQMLTEIS